MPTSVYLLTQDAMKRIDLVCGGRLPQSNNLFQDGSLKVGTNENKPQLKKNMLWIITSCPNRAITLKIKRDSSIW